MSAAAASSPTESCAAAPALGHGKPVIGQAPAGIKGQTVHSHFSAANQGFEAGQRSHGLDPVGPGNPVIDAARSHHHIGPGHRCTAGAQARCHVRMFLVGNEGIGKKRPHRCHQTRIGADCGRAVTDRGILFHLSGNQDFQPAGPGIWQIGCLADIVFRHATVTTRSTRPRPGQSVRHRNMVGQNVFEPAFTTSIVIGILPVHRQRAG